MSASPYDDTLKSPKTNTLSDGLIERISSILDKIVSSSMLDGIVWSQEIVSFDETASSLFM